jgi:hypothetical protein
MGNRSGNCATSSLCDGAQIYKLTSLRLAEIKVFTKIYLLTVRI